jgi:hypothetical protein
MSETKRLKGHEAIRYAEACGGDIRLSKFADPIEDAREDLSVDEARRVASEDPTLIYIDAPAGALYDPRCYKCGELLTGGEGAVQINLPLEANVPSGPVGSSFLASDKKVLLFCMSHGQEALARQRAGVQ